MMVSSQSTSRERGEPVVWASDTVQPPGPAFDALGHPFGRPPSLAVPVIWVIAVLLAVEAGAVAIVSIALKSERTRLTTASAASESSGAEAGRPVSTGESPRSDSGTGSGLPESRSAASTTPEQAATSATDSPFDWLRGRDLVLAVETNQAGPQTLGQLPAEKLELQLLGGGSVLTAGKLSLEPAGHLSGRGQAWELRRVGALSASEDLPIGRITWQNGDLQFEWLGTAEPSFRYCVLQVRATSAGRDETERCRLLPILQMPSGRPDFNRPKSSIPIPLTAAIPITPQQWRLRYRLDGVPDADPPGQSELKVNESVTVKFPNPEEPGASLFEMDVQLQNESGKPAVLISYWTERQTLGNDMTLKTTRLPLSRPDALAIAKREEAQFPKLIRTIEALDERISKLKPDPKTLSEKRQREDLLERQSRLELQLSRSETIGDWHKLVTEKMTEVESQCSLEFELGVSFSDPQVPFLELARTAKYLAADAPVSSNQQSQTF